MEPDTLFAKESLGHSSRRFASKLVSRKLWEKSVGVFDGVLLSHLKII
jgi:hypothetical protein